MNTYAGYGVSEVYPPAGGEEIPVVSEDSGGVFQKIARFALYALIFLLPIWYLPLTTLPVEANKAFLTSVLALVALIAWIGSGLQEGKITLNRSWALFALGAFLVVIVVSAVLGIQSHASLIGSLGDPRSVMTLLAGAIVAFLIPSVLHRKEDVMKSVVLLMFASVLVLVAFLIRSVLNIEYMGSRGFNLIGSWNGLGVFFGLMAAFTFPMLGVPSESRAWKAALLLLVSGLVGAFLVNYKVVWIAIAAIALVFFALYFSANKRKSVLFTLTFFLIILSVLLALLNPQLSGIAARFGSVAEVTPAWQSTLEIGKQVIADRPIVGAGPNTFGYLWESFRPEGISQTQFWRVRFNSGVGFTPSLMVETGILGTASIVALLLLLGWMVIRTMVSAAYRTADAWEAATALASASGFVFLAAMSFFYAFNSTLALLMFLMLGIFFSASARVGVGKTTTIDLFASAQTGFVASLVMIVAVITSVFGLYLGSTRFAADVAYAEGVRLFNDDQKLDAAISEVERATNMYSDDDGYWRTLTELQRLKLQQIAQDQSISQQDREVRIQAELARAIRFGERTTDLNAVDAENWRTRGRVYESVIPLTGAADVALEHYNKASELSPHDPLIVGELARLRNTRALVAAQTKNQPLAEIERAEAVKLLERAIEIKSDYAPAHFTLAQYYSAAGKQDQALQRAVTAYQLEPSDVGAAFQLGVLAYQLERKDIARIALERAVSLRENYSNARYFLGLIYDEANAKELAIQQFVRIQELNPTNAEVMKILENLRSGKKALDGITPPPEERDAPPITEEGTNSNSTAPKQ